MNLNIKKLSDHTGAEIDNINLNKIYDEGIYSELNKAFLKYSVLVIRNQDLSPNEFHKSSQIFGKIFEQHNKKFSLKDNNLVHYISNKDKYEDGKIYIPGEGYHTDHSNDPNPPKATILHAKEIPSYGGDTQFVNMNLIYKKLPSKLKNKINDLKAVHVYQSSHSKRKLMALSNKSEKQDETIHSIIRTHPENKKKCLYINPIRIENIIGLTNSESIKLLEKLMKYVSKKDFEYRHKWKLGDFVIWDNRILMHKANGDYDMNEKRYLYRLMIQNEEY
ncbi:MAG: TauD/TfdA family dioxygenase [Proteobacteria bacterium]|nr:TauD/TfdA family dioxygenase [Pseudomonadota bacterium]